MAELEFHVTAENRDFLTKIRQVHDKVSETTKKVQSEGNKMDDIFRNLGASIASLGAGFTATKLISDIVRVRGEFQQLEIAMETMLGSKAKADALMSQLVATAAKTPFGLTDIAQGAKQLLAYGTASEEVNDTLVRLGNIASGLSIPLNDLVYLYGTTMTQGRLFTQDLRQFMGRGIPLADELAKQFGVTKDKVGELVTEGKVGFPEVEKAIHAMTNEGGKFYNLMEKQSASLTGQISNLEDAWDMMLNEIGTKTQGIASGAISSASLLIENYEKVGRIILEIAGVYGTYKAALAAGTAIQKVNTLVMEEAAVQIKLAAMAHHNLTIQQAKAIARTNLLTIAKKKLLTTMKGLGKALTNPYVLAAAAVTALGFGIYKLVTYQTEAEKAQKRLNDAFAEASSSAGTEIKKLDELKGRLSAAKKGSAEYYEIKNEIVKNFGKYDSTLADEIERVGDLSTKYDTLAKAIQDSANARMYDKYVEEETERYDKDVTGKLKKLQDTIYGAKGISTEDAARTYSKIWKNIFQGEALDEETQRVIDSFNEIKYVSTGYGPSMSNNVNAVEDYIRGLKDLNVQQDEFINNARTMFGFGADTSDFNKGLKNLTEEQLNQTKKDLDEILKKFRDTKQEQSYALVSGEDITFATEQQINDAISNVDAYLEQIKKNRLENQPQDTEIEENAIKKAEQTAEKVAEASRKAEIDLRKAQTDDEIELIKIERDAKIRALNDELEAYKAIYEAAGKDTTLLEQQFARMIEIEQQMADIEITDANKEKADNMKEEMTDLLKEFESYQQALTRIEQEYEEKRKMMYEEDGKTFKAGFDDDNVRELERKKKEAIEDIAETYADKSEAFESWADSLSSIAIGSLKQMLALAKAQLDILKNTEGADELEIAQAEAAIASLQTAIDNTSSSNDVAKSKWTEINKVLTDCADTFIELGGVIPGVAGKMMSAIGEIATSAIQIANGISAMGDASEEAGKQLSNIDKASVILMVISAAIKAVSKVTEIANANQEANEEAARSAREYAEALEDVSIAARLNTHSTVFGKDSFGELIEQATIAKEKIDEIKLSMSDFAAYIAATPIDAGHLFDSWTGQLHVEADHRSDWQKWWGIGDDNVFDFNLAELFDEEGNAVKAKFEELVEWYSTHSDFMSGKDKATVEAIIADWERYEEAIEGITTYVSSLFGSMQSQVADSMIDSWIETGNAISDTTALVGDYAKALAKASIEKMLFENIFTDEAQKKIIDMMSNGEVDNALMYLTQLMESANELAPAIDSLLHGVDEITGGSMTSQAKDEREAYTKSGITASQDSVDRVDARLTAMQGHTFSISEDCKRMSNYGSQMISRLSAIERNTSFLAGISERLQNLSSDIEDIKNKGIPML